MQHADGLAFAGGASVLAKPGEFYLVYLPFGGPAALDLEGHVGPFLVSWFDARNGGDLQNGAVTQVSGPGTRSLGSPPGAGDWVAFVRRAANVAPLLESITVGHDPFLDGQDFSLQVHARDPNGPGDSLRVRLELTDPVGNSATLLLPHRGGDLYSLFLANQPVTMAGVWRAEVSVRDSEGLVATGSTSFRAQ